MNKLANISEYISIQTSINCLVPGMQYGSNSHSLILTAQENLRCELYAIPLPQNIQSTDFHICYRAQTNAISALSFFVSFLFLV